MAEEKISISFEEYEYDSLDDIIKELNIRGLKIRNRSEAVDFHFSPSKML
jgi:hypothetical protein